MGDVPRRESRWGRGRGGGRRRCSSGRRSGRAHKSGAIALVRHGGGAGVSTIRGRTGCGGERRVVAGGHAGVDGFVCALAPATVSIDRAPGRTWWGGADDEPPLAHCLNVARPNPASTELAPRCVARVLPVRLHGVRWSEHSTMYPCHPAPTPSLRPVHAQTLSMPSTGRRS